MPFTGFSDGSPSTVHIPEQFFYELLPDIDHLGELHLTLYIFWRLEQVEGPFHYLRGSDLFGDAGLMQFFGATPANAQAAAEDALQRAVQRGSLLAATLVQGEEAEQLIFLNSPRGRAAVEAIQRGEWRLTSSNQQPLAPFTQRPNIFQLYETNIGPLTPMMAETLREAEKTYPAQWIEDAFRIAVEKNKRNWRYAEAILKRWQERGRDERKDRRDTEEARRRYAEWEK